jgi:ATP-dependent helicase IRC3
LNKSTANELRGGREEPTLQAPSAESGIAPVEDVKLQFTKYDSVYDLLEDVQSERHIRSISRNSWVRVGNDKYILSESSGWLTLEKENDIFNVRHVMKFTDPVSEQAQFTRPRLIASGSDLETAVRAADTYASDKFEEHFIASWKPWRQNPATAGQIKLLNQAGIRKGKVQAGELNRGQAADMITKLKFGGKKRFKQNEMQRRKAERQADAAKKMSELQKRTEVKVGPLEG